jgi:hypothetical protein
MSAKCYLLFYIGLELRSLTLREDLGLGLYEEDLLRGNLDLKREDVRLQQLRKGRTP